MSSEGGKPTKKQPPMQVKLIGAGVVLSIMFLTIFLITVGPGAHPETKARNLNVKFASFDAGNPATGSPALVGTALVGFFTAMEAKAMQTLPKFEHETSMSEAQLIDSVQNGDCWAAVYATSSSTAALQTAYMIKNITYDPTQAIVIVYAEARNVQAVKSWIYGPLTGLLGGFATTFSKNFIANAASTYPLNMSFTSVAKLAPNILAAPVSYNARNLAPFTVQATLAGFQNSMIYSILFGMFILNAVLGITAPLANRLPPMKLAWTRLGISYLLALPLGIFLTCVFVAFGASFSGGDFIGFSLISWLHICVHTTYFFTGFNLGGAPVLGAFVGPAIVFNLAGGASTLELASDFYKFGYITPVFHVIQSYRTLIFSHVYNRLYYNIPVLIAWLILWFLVSSLLVKKNAKKQADAGAPDTETLKQQPSTLPLNSAESGVQSIAMTRLNTAGSSEEQPARPTNAE